MVCKRLHFCLLSLLACLANFSGSSTHAVIRFACQSVFCYPCSRCLVHIVVSVPYQIMLVEQVNSFWGLKIMCILLVASAGGLININQQHGNVHSTVNAKCQKKSSQGIGNWILVSQIQMVSEYSKETSDNLWMLTLESADDSEILTFFRYKYSYWQLFRHEKGSKGSEGILQYNVSKFFGSLSRLKAGKQ